MINLPLRTEVIPIQTSRVWPTRILGKATIRDYGGILRKSGVNVQAVEPPGVVQYVVPSKKLSLGRIDNNYQMVERRRVLLGRSVEDQTVFSDR